MQLFACMALFAAFFASAMPAFAREPFSLEREHPQSAQDIATAMRGNDPQTSISAYLGGAQCGGWNKNESVASHIAHVSGLPGREHQWDGDIPSGMGTRTDTNDDGNDDNDYQFPESTQGLVTACVPGNDRTPVDVWEQAGAPFFTVEGEEITPYQRREHVFAYPYFENPVCRWRFEGGGGPGIPLVPDDNIPISDKNTFETEDPGSCLDFCTYVNRFMYEDCAETTDRVVQVSIGNDDNGDPLTDDEGNPITFDVPVTTCERRAYFYICTREEVNPENWNFNCSTTPTEMDEWANARMCKGDQCRCPASDVQNQYCVSTPSGDIYQSYERIYQNAGYQREPLWEAGVGGDVASRDLTAACYGLYNEFDPKFRQTNGSDRRCVINVDVSDMRTSQVSDLTKVEYRGDDVEDRDPTDTSLQRPGGENNEPGTFDRDKDTWYQKLGGAFSFINEKLFEDQYKKDLGNVFLAYDALDSGKQTATPQINSSRLFAESDLMRAFDDTGNARAYTRWWQEQQTRMAAILKTPVLRIVLPSAWFVGLDPNDPFLKSVDSGTSSTLRANRADRVELQIDADEDTLGTALAYIERSVLLHVEEEPMPIVVPMGSPVEFRARAADWCNWYKSQNGKTDCNEAPQEVRNVITRLEEYAQRIDDYRILRAKLAESAGAVLDVQHKLLQPIAQWFADHESDIKALADARARVEQQLLPQWQAAQHSLARMTDVSNLPWCMNQRFTAPIYSELDQWLPSRLSNGAVNELGLPVLPAVPRPDDVIVDFSAITTMSGTLKIPVLKPIQIRVDLPTPPSPHTLPELPSIDAISQAMDDALGKLPNVVNELGDPPSMRPPAPMDESIMNHAQLVLSRMEEILSDMNDRYDRFWKSIGPIVPGQEQFEQQEEFKTQLKCRDFDDLPCEHVEMDLLERVQRIGSRPLVQLQEDFQSLGTRRSESTVCLPDDETCELLNPERTDPAFRWEVRGSSANDAPIDDLRLHIFELTQPPPLGTLDPAILGTTGKDPSPVQAFPLIRLLP